MGNTPRIVPATTDPHVTLTSNFTFDVKLTDKDGQGGVLYVEDGQLKWRDDNGKVTVLAPLEDD